jgi:hypothetical protein
MEKFLRRRKTEYLIEINKNMERIDIIEELIKTILAIIGGVWLFSKIPQWLSSLYVESKEKSKKIELFGIGISIIALIIALFK